MIQKVFKMKLGAVELKACGHYSILHKLATSNIKRGPTYIYSFFSKDAIGGGGGGRAGEGKEVR
jgi:hypothetical protein